MSFVGSIVAPLRKVLASYAGEVCLPALLPCAGNFTMGSALRSGGYQGRITGCDITLYTSALGAYLAGDRLEVSEREDCPEHLRGLLDTSSPAHLTASLSLLLDLYQVWKKKNVWHERVLDNQRKNWRPLMEKTLTRLAAFKAHMCVGEGCAYHPMDALEFLRMQDKAQAIFIAPPTYGSKGYMKLNEVLDAVAAWKAPSYSEINFNDLPVYEKLTSFRQWFIIMEKVFPGIEDVLGKPVAIVHKGRNSICHAFASQSKKTFVTRAYLKSASPGPIFPSDKTLTGEEQPGMVILSYPQTIRMSELFMSARVDYSHTSFLLSVGFCLDSKLIGKADFKLNVAPWKLPTKGSQIYQLSDLAVPSEKIPRLSKLVLMLIQSHELRQLLIEKLPEDWEWTTTTAFCRGPVSMKYRGVFKLHKRLPGEEPNTHRLNYYAPLGQWSMAEAYQNWRKKYHK